MGRPLNPRYLGVPRGQPVLLPVVRLHDKVQAAWIVNQTNKHSYICRQTLSGSQGLCKLANNLDHNGNMLLRFQDPHDQIFYCSRITNLFVWDFHGQKYPWTFHAHLVNPQQSYVCIIDAVMNYK
jgi:hypothetical protein